VARTTASVIKSLVELETALLSVHSSTSRLLRQRSALSKEMRPFHCLNALWTVLPVFYAISCIRAAPNDGELSRPPRSFRI